MRIVTRPDFDGVVCAVLLFEAEPVEAPVRWVQPSDLQQGRVEVTGDDILANLPFHPRCRLWFDHHYTNRIDRPFRGAFSMAPSAARVIFSYYQDRFRKDFSELVDQADKIDAADLTLEEVRRPQDHPYVLVSMTIGDREPSDAAYCSRLVDLFRELSIEGVVADAEVARRCRRAEQRNQAFEKELLAHTTVQGHVAVSDFRPLGQDPQGNRFLVYSLFPETAVSVKIRYADSDRNRIRVSVGRSIFNRTCQVNVGLMLAQFGGGGHRAAGGCTFDTRMAEEYLPRMIEILRKNESNETE
ncbi:MAG: exopolyphosphatase [Desulfobacteraceae bacterium]|jgi:hypothetical protein|nr:exopolyphosphatase [Desulfobacteraceae bacterium]